MQASIHHNLSPFTSHLRELNSHYLQILSVAHPRASGSQDRAAQHRRGVEGRVGGRVHLRQAGRKAVAQVQLA